jgi:hypothetical protein
MVEDEFLSTAGLYTAHLHHASYRQHIKQAAARAKSAMTPITRATVADEIASMATQKQIELDELRMRQKKGSVNMGLEEDDDPWMKDPLLKGLMGKDRIGTGVKIGKFVRSQERSQSYQTGGSLDTAHEEDDRTTDLDDLDAVPLIRKPVSRSQAVIHTQTTNVPKSSPPEDEAISLPRQRELTGKLRERFNRSQRNKEKTQDRREIRSAQATQDVQATSPITMSRLISQSKEETDSGFNLPKPRQLKGKFAEKFRRTRGSQIQETTTTNTEIKNKDSGPRISDIPFFLI